MSPFHELHVRMDQEGRVRPEGDYWVELSLRRGLWGRLRWKYRVTRDSDGAVREGAVPAASLDDDPGDVARHLVRDAAWGQLDALLDAPVEPDPDLVALFGRPSRLDNNEGAEP